MDHNKIDLVVLDPELAYMSDFSLSRKLKNKLNGMPVIIHSFGNGDNRHEEISNKTLFVEKGSRSVERIKQEAKKLLERA